MPQAQSTLAPPLRPLPSPPNPSLQDPAIGFPALAHPDAKVRMYLVYLKCWTLNLMPLMVYPKVLFHPNFSIKAGPSLAPRSPGLLATPPVQCAAGKVVLSVFSEGGVVGISCGVLVFLYVFQYVGTNHLGWAFSPIVVAWLLFNTIIGIYNIAHWHPGEPSLPACTSHQGLNNKIYIMT